MDEMDCIDHRDGFVDPRGHDWRLDEPRGATDFSLFHPIEMLDATTTERCDKCEAVRQTWLNEDGSRRMQTYSAAHWVPG